MTPSNDTGCGDAALQGCVRHPLVAGPPQAVLLFGSSARGTAAADSDDDLLVVEDTLRRPTKRGVRYLLAVRTPDESRAPLGLSYPSEVMRKGRVLA